VFRDSACDDISLGIADAATLPTSRGILASRLRHRREIDPDAANASPARFPVDDYMAALFRGPLMSATRVLFLIADRYALVIGTLECIATREGLPRNPEAPPRSPCNSVIRR